MDRDRGRIRGRNRVRGRDRGGDRGQAIRASLQKTARKPLPFASSAPTQYSHQPST